MHARHDILFVAKTGRDPLSFRNGEQQATWRAGALCGTARAFKRPPDTSLLARNGQRSWKKGFTFPAQSFCDRRSPSLGLYLFSTTITTADCKDEERKKLAANHISLQGNSRIIAITDRR